MFADIPTATKNAKCKSTVKSGQYISLNHSETISQTEDSDTLKRIL